MSSTEASSEVSKNLEEDLQSKAEKNEINSLLDDLHLVMLHQIEEQALLHLQANRQICKSREFLARIRLQHGYQSTYVEAQLSRWRPYKALVRLLEVSTAWGTVLKLIRLPVALKNGFCQPLANIFGSLLPTTFRAATRQWENCVDLMVACANIQRELHATVDSIRQLRRRLDRW